MQNTTSSKSPIAENAAGQKAQVEIPTPEVPAIEQQNQEKISPPQAPAAGNATPAPTSKIGAKLPLEKKSPPPGGRTADDTTVVSWRLTAKGMAAYKILKAKHPGIKITDLISDLLVAAAEEAEATPPISFQTLDGAEYILIKGTVATLISALKSFRSNLLSIDHYPDDAKRTEAISILYKFTEEKIKAFDSLLSRIARIALLPKIPTLGEFKQLTDLKIKLTTLKNEATTPEEKAIYALGLKLIAPFLP